MRVQILRKKSLWNVDGTQGSGVGSVRDAEAFQACTLFSNKRILEGHQNMNINCQETMKVMRIQRLWSCTVTQHQWKWKWEELERMKRAWTLMECSDCKETPKNLLVSLNISGDSWRSGFNSPCLVARIVLGLKRANTSYLLKGICCLSRR